MSLRFCLSYNHAFVNQFCQAHTVRICFLPEIVGAYLLLEVNGPFRMNVRYPFAVGREPPFEAAHSGK